MMAHVDPKNPDLSFLLDPRSMASPYEFMMMLLFIFFFSTPALYFWRSYLQTRKRIKLNPTEKWRWRKDWNMGVGPQINSLVCWILFLAFLPFLGLHIIPMLNLIYVVGWEDADVAYELGLWAILILILSIFSGVFWRLIQRKQQFNVHFDTPGIIGGTFTARVVVTEKLLNSSTPEVQVQLICIGGGLHQNFEWYHRDNWRYAVDMAPNFKPSADKPGFFEATVEFSIPPDEKPTHESIPTRRVCWLVGFGINPKKVDASLLISVPVMDAVPEPYHESKHLQTAP